MLATDWTEDAELGVAVREVGDDLHVRALHASGRERISAAIQAAYESWYWPRSATMQSFVTSGVPSRPPTDCAWIIGPAHRLAFARALSPIECEVVCNK
jgi:hypothetical protein